MNGIYDGKKYYTGWWYTYPSTFPIDEKNVPHHQPDNGINYYKWYNKKGPIMGYGGIS